MEYIKLNNNYCCNILKEEYVFEDKNVITTIHCNISLHEFEHKYFNFTESFINKHISNWLPTVKTIYNYSLDNPIVAKFYILPSSAGTHTAKVLEYNDDYYREMRHIPTDKRVQKGSIINVKQIPGVYFKGGETSSLDYCETFKSIGIAKCHPDDSFNEDTGKHIALCKAMNHATNTFAGIISDIQKLIEPINKHITEDLEYLRTANINSEI